MIAGEGLIGILLAVLAVFGVGEALDLSKVLNLPAWASNLGSVLLLVISVLVLVRFSLAKKKSKKADEE